MSGLLDLPDIRPLPPRSGGEEDAPLQPRRLQTRPIPDSVALQLRVQAVVPLQRRPSLRRSVSMLNAKKQVERAPNPAAAVAAAIATTRSSGSPHQRAHALAPVTMLPHRLPVKQRSEIPRSALWMQSSADIRAAESLRHSSSNLGGASLLMMTTAPHLGMHASAADYTSSLPARDQPQRRSDAGAGLMQSRSRLSCGSLTIVGNTMEPSQFESFSSSVGGGWPGSLQEAQVQDSATSASSSVSPFRQNCRGRRISALSGILPCRISEERTLA